MVQYTFCFITMRAPIFLCWNFRTGAPKLLEFRAGVTSLVLTHGHDLDGKFSLDWEKIANYPNLPFFSCFLITRAPQENIFWPVGRRPRFSSLFFDGQFNEWALGRPCHDKRKFYLVWLLSRRWRPSTWSSIRGDISIASYDLKNGARLQSRQVLVRLVSEQEHKKKIVD